MIRSFPLTLFVLRNQHLHGYVYLSKKNVIVGMLRFTKTSWICYRESFIAVISADKLALAFFVQVMDEYEEQSDIAEKFRIKVTVISIILV